MPKTVLTTKKVKDFILKHITINTQESNTYSVQIIDGYAVCDKDIDGSIFDETVMCTVCNTEIDCNGELDHIINHIKEKHPEVMV